jgi:hypothetical protein
VITSKNYFVTKMDRYNKYWTKQYTHANTSTLHLQQLVLGWVTNHQVRPPAPTNNLHKLHESRRVIKFYLLKYTYVHHATNYPRYEILIRFQWSHVTINILCTCLQVSLSRDTNTRSLYCLFPICL